MVSMRRTSERVVTLDEYLALERAAEFKSEYLNGQIYAMAGSSPEHSAITANLVGALFAQLAYSPCQVFSSDMKVRTSPSELFAYPDLSIVCGEPHFHNEKRDVLINPTVIVEVLLESTEAYDRGKKFILYRQLQSLSDYVLVTQDAPYIERYTRQSHSEWHLSIATGLVNNLELPSIDCTLAFADIYRRIQFSESTP